MNKNKYYAAALTAFIAWGFFGFVLKPIQSYPSLDILFYRVFFSATVMLVISAAFRTKVLRSDRAVFKALPVQKKQVMIIQVIAGGFLLAANWFSFIYVMNHISIKAASFAYVIAPVATTLLACFFLNEKLSRGQWAAIGLSLVSCMILSYDSLSDLFYSLTVALSYSLFLIVQPRNENFDKFLLLAIQVLCAALILLPFYPAYHSAFPTDPSFYFYIVIIGIFFTILPLWLNLFALKGLNSSVVGILMYIYPLMNFMVAVLYYHEPINSSQIIAYLIILLSVVIFNMFRESTPGVKAGLPQ